MSDDNDDGYYFTDDDGNHYEENAGPEQEQPQDKNNSNKVLSVLEAKRVHCGHVTVRGKIISRGDMYVIEVSTGPL